MPNLFRHPIILVASCLASGMLKQVQHDYVINRAVTLSLSKGERRPARIDSTGSA